MSPQAKHIISKGKGVYATPILQPTTPVAHLARGLAIYAYLPMDPCRLPRPSPADRLFFTDASGESALTPITGGATLQLTHTGGHYHMDHHTGHTTYGASSHGELGAMADAIAEIAAHLPAHLPHIVRVWFVLDATVDTHLLLHIARQPLHKATATSLGTQALLLWKALRSPPPPTSNSTSRNKSPTGTNTEMVRSTTRQYTSAQRTYQPSRSLTSAETTHTSNTYPPYPSPIRPRTGYQRTPPIPPTTEHTTTPTPSNISPACSATQTAGRTSRSSRTDCKSPATTQHCAQQTSQPTSKNDASSSSGSNYHSSPGSQMARPQAHPRPRRTHLLPVRPHHPGGLGTLQEMPPPYRQGHASGLVPGGNPTTTRRMANPQPRTPGHRTPLPGSPGQRSHHEGSGDTGPQPTPHQTHGKPHGGSSTPPARGSPQSSGPNGTPQTPPVNTHGTTHRPHRQGTHAPSHPLPCRA